MSKKKANRPELSLVQGGLSSPDEHTIVDWAGIAKKVDIPADEKVIVKEVPAIVDGDHGERAEVGIAQIYEDGTVSVIIDNNAPQWALDLIKGEADSLGYSIPEGVFTDGPA